MQGAQIQVSQILSQLSKLDVASLEKVVREGLSIIKNKKEKDPEIKELKLLEKLNNTTLDKEKLARFVVLIEKRKEETISDEEFLELTELIKEDQVLHTKRINILGELAQLKGISIQSLAEKLELKPPPSV